MARLLQQAVMCFLAELRSSTASFCCFLFIWVGHQGQSHVRGGEWDCCCKRKGQGISHSTMSEEGHGSEFLASVHFFVTPVKRESVAFHCLLMCTRIWCLTTWSKGLHLTLLLLPRKGPVLTLQQRGRGKDWDRTAKTQAHSENSHSLGYRHLNQEKVQGKIY